MTTEDIQALKASMRSALMGAVNSALRAESDDLPERWEDVTEAATPRVWKGPIVDRMAREVRSEAVRLLADAWEAE